ncbi:MAG: hypothetical protein A4S09_15370 [Proteobacteria bacterium SG_bin7]|nr:MAG: hypothetical protein A4S09_15370 [Proteobacteria bacterium SG_bin7]
MVKTFCLLWMLVGQIAFAQEHSLFSDVELVRFDNGFTVVLAPSREARIFSIELEVDVGWDVENADNFGVSHLLEHSLFRDSRLAEDLTYLQLIEENGGSANGFTYPRKTVYKASVNRDKSEWLLNQFYKMLNDRSFLQDHIDKEKDAVLLEIGKPGVIAETLGFDLLAALKPRSLELPDFWESEFKVKFDSHEFSRDEERLSTIKLRADQINKHYEEYYHPANMRFYVAGRFDPKKVKSLFENTWAKVPANPNGKSIPDIGKPTPSKHPYIRTRVTQDNPSITYGTKFWDLTRVDEEVMESYTNYLSHSLMKELRNKKGQTYTVSPSTSVQNKFGYGLISFQTRHENFRENLKLVKSLIQRQTHDTGLTEQEFIDAKDLYLKKFDLTDGNSDTMLRIANLYYYFFKEYKDMRTPAEVFQEIDLKTYNEKLKNLFGPERRYSYNYVPPYFFRYENMIMMAIMVFVMLLGVQKKLLLKPFAHGHVRWMRNIRYLPFKAVEIALTAVLVYLFVFLEFYLIDQPFYQLSFLNDSLVFAEYIPNILSVILLTATINFGFAVYPRRAFIVKDTLILKTLTYFSYHIPLSEIQGAEARWSYTFPFPISIWTRVRWRLFFFGPPWKKGLLLNLKNGRSWFLGISEAPLAADEIMKLVSESQKTSVSPVSVPEITSAAASQ